MRLISRANSRLRSFFFGKLVLETLAGRSALALSPYVIILTNSNSLLFGA